MEPGQEMKLVSKPSLNGPSPVMVRLSEQLKLSIVTSAVAALARRNANAAINPLVSFSLIALPFFRGPRWALRLYTWNTWAETAFLSTGLTYSLAITDQLAAIQH
jgi:hypothetical protein